MIGALRGWIVAIGMLVCLGLFRVGSAKPPLQPVPWTATADSAMASAGPATTQPVDPFRLKSTISLSPIFPGDRDLIVPERPSRFVLSKNPFADGFELWDLSIGAKVKAGTGTLSLEDIALSPDGQYVAGGMRPNRANPNIEVGSLRTSKVVSEISFDGGSRPKVAGFVEPNRILIVDGLGADARWQLCDLLTGKQVAAWKQQIPFSGTVALSPTGKFAAVVADGVLRVCDTSNGRVCGQMDFTQVADFITKWASDAAAIAFSPDGQMLGVILFDHPRVRLIQIAMNGGGVVSDSILDIPAPPPWGMKFALRYSSDNSRLLLNHKIVIDSSTHAVILDIPARQDPIFGAFADTDHVVQIYKVNRQFFFNSTTIPSETARRVAAVKGGGKAEDGSLPPLSAVDASSAEVISHENVLSDPWIVKPAALGPNHVKPAAYFGQHPSPEAMPVQPHESSHEVGAILFTGREAHSVFIEHVQRNNSPAGGTLHQTYAWIERDELVGGTGTGAFVVPPLLQAMDCSSSGKTLVFRGGSELDRIDVFQAQGPTFKPLVAFRPYDNAAARATPNVTISAAPAPGSRFRHAEPPPPVAVAAPEPVSSIVKAALVDETHLLTLSSRNRLMMWDLQSVKALWVADLGQNMPQILSLSPDRQLAVLGNLVIIDALSGKPLNALETGDTLPASATFSPDGTQLAAVYHINGAGLLRVFDLNTGALASDAAIPPDAARDLDTVTFVAPNYMLVGHGALISLEKNAVVWKYAVNAFNSQPSYRTGSVIPYDAAFFVVSVENPRPAHTIVCLSMPDESAKKATAALDPASVFLWSPGMAVKLDLSVEGDEAQRDQTAKAITKALKSQGIDVVPESTNILSARYFTISGESIVYRGGGQEATLTRKYAGHQITLTRDGTEIWKDVYDHAPERPRFGFMGPMMIFVSLNPGESLQQAVDRMYAQQFSPSVICPPVYVFKNRTIFATTIGPRGVESQTRFPGVGQRPGR